MNSQMNACKATVAITGASGDIGIGLSKYFYQKGHRIKLLIRSPESKSKFIKHSKLHLPEECYMIGDLYDRDLNLEVIKKSDIIYHLAGSVGLDRNSERYSEYLKTNGLAAIGLVKWAEKVNPKIRFVFASTQRIYNIEGKQEVKVWVDTVLTMLDRNQGYDTLFFQEPQYEKKLEDFSNEILQNVPIPEGVHPYELFKFLVECYLKRSRLKSFITLRISSVYGPGTYSGKMIQKLIEIRLKGEIKEESKAIEKYCIRNFIYIEDALKIMYQAGMLSFDGITADVVNDSMFSPDTIWDVIVKHTPMDNGKVVFIGDNFGRLDLEGNQKETISELFLQMVNGIQKFTNDDVPLDLIKKELDNKNNPYTKTILRLLDTEYNVKNPNQIFEMDEQRLKDVWVDILNRLIFMNDPDDIPNNYFFSKEPEIEAVMEIIKKENVHLYKYILLRHFFFGSNHKSVFTNIETGLYHQIEDLRTQLI